MLEPQVVEGLIAAVRNAARSEIIPRFRTLSPDQISSKSAHDDLVTAADIGMEARLTPILQDLLPACEVLGEEACAANPDLLHLPAQAKTCAILDPVDGTWNFAKGLALFGTILSVTRAGKTIWALLYDPLMDDWITASPSKGAWYTRPGQTPIALKLPETPPVEAQIGFLAPALFPQHLRADLAAAGTVFNRCYGLRCTLHEYRTLAQSGCHWLMAHDPKPWDHAAGALIISEAGGHVAWLDDGTDYSAARTKGTVLAATNLAHWQALRAHFAPVLQPNA